jgi:hypothetical protein
MRAEREGGNMSKKKQPSLTVWMVRNSGGDKRLEVNYRKPAGKVKGRFTYKGATDYAGRRTELDKLLRAAGFKIRPGEKLECVLTVKHEH